MVIRTYREVKIKHGGNVKMRMNKDEIKSWLTAEGQKLYGQLLDEIRVSDCGDRQFKQMEKDVKQLVRESMDGIASVLEGECACDK